MSEDENFSEKFKKAFPNYNGKQASEEEKTTDEILDKFNEARENAWEAERSGKPKTAAFYHKKLEQIKICLDKIQGKGDGGIER